MRMVHSEPIIAKISCSNQNCLSILDEIFFLPMIRGSDIRTHFEILKLSATTMLLIMCPLQLSFRCKKESHMLGWLTLVLYIVSVQRQHTHLLEADVDWLVPLFRHKGRCPGMILTRPRYCQEQSPACVPVLGHGSATWGWGLCLHDTT